MSNFDRCGALKLMGAAGRSYRSATVGASRASFRFREGSSPFRTSSDIVGVSSRACWTVSCPWSPNRGLRIVPLSAQGGEIGQGRKANTSWVSPNARIRSLTRTLRPARTAPGTSRYSRCTCCVPPFQPRLGDLQAVRARPRAARRTHRLRPSHPRTSGHHRSNPMSEATPERRHTCCSVI